MSDYEDHDLDDDLPCVSLSQSIGGKSELEMPPASQLASLRAREDAAERALQDLHENNDPLLISLSRSTSQSSTSEEGEAALSAAVSALQVTEPQPVTLASRAERVQLLTAMREHFPEDQFLESYIQMLKDKPEAVDSVTEHILQGITSALISDKCPTVPNAAAWLLSVALSTPRALRVRRALHAILDVHASDAHVRVLAAAVCGAIEDAEQLLAAYDAVRSGARRGADRLASVLLAHAMARVLAQKETLPSNENPPHPLSSKTVSLVRASWRKLSTRAQLTLLRCAGRALAGDTGGIGDRGVGDGGDIGDRGVGDKKDIGDGGDIGDRGVGDKRDIVDMRDIGDRAVGDKRDSGDRGVEDRMDIGDRSVGDRGDIGNGGVGDVGDWGTEEKDSGDRKDISDMMETGDKRDKEGIMNVEKKEKMDIEDSSGVGAEFEYQDSRPPKSTNSNDVDTMERTHTDPRAREREGGAALLAALAQPLARASTFDINRQQVLTNVSKLQLLFRERFIHEPEAPKSIISCSQNSLESLSTEATPTKTGIEMKIKIPMKMVRPMKLSFPILTPQKTEHIKKTIKGQLKLDGFFKQGTQVTVARDDDKSPEAKRPKRRPERRCAQKSSKN